MFNAQHICIFLFFLFSNTGFSQNRDATTSIKGIIVNVANNQPIPYVKVFNRRSKKGTLSNTSGTYEIQIEAPTDSIAFSFTGFEKNIFEGRDLLKMDTVFLREESAMLGAVNILADDAFLYRLINSCKSNKLNKHKSAKTYFSLETAVDNKQVELVECYYNGDFSNYDVNALDLKKGRVALNGVGDRLSTSLDISKVFYMHKLFEDNAYFPGSPFELNKRQLRKVYKLSLSSRYIDEQAGVVYVIKFKPKKEAETFFSGMVWIDSVNQQIHKVDFKINAAKIHPFIYNSNKEKLEGVDMHLTKTFEEIDGRMMIEAVYFDFELTHNAWEDSLKSIKRSTQSVMYAYNYESPFVLPYFNYSMNAGDYRKISVAPYDHYFWKNYKEFNLTDHNNRNEDFFKSADLTNEIFFDTKYFTRGEYGMFESEYIAWSDDRIYFREDYRPDTAINEVSSAGVIPSELYNLSVQIFLDIDQYNDTLTVFTETIFDPFESYFYLPRTAKSTAFINLYFDLVEIQRRELEAQILSKEHTVSSIQQLYQKRMELIEKQSWRYFKEVDRGENRKAFEKWNAYVFDKLNVDNIAIFDPFEE